MFNLVTCLPSLLILHIMLPDATQAVYRVRNTAVSNVDWVLNVDWLRYVIALHHKRKVAWQVIDIGSMTVLFQ